MTTPQSYLAKKALKASVRHAAHGTASKVQRQPLRSAKLITLGAILGSAGTFAFVRARRLKAESAAARARAADESGGREAAVVLPFEGSAPAATGHA